MIKKWFKKYITENKYDILIVISLIIIGVIAGIGIYIFMGTATKELAIESIKSVFDISKEETYVKTNIILNGIKADFIMIIVLAIFTVTLFGKWAIYALMILKGIAITLYTCLLFGVFGAKWGLLVILLLVLLVNIIYIPALIYLVISLLTVNFNLFKARISSINTTAVIKLLIKILVSFIIMFSSIVVEQIVSTIVLDIYTRL